MKKYGIVAYYGTGFGEGNELKPLYIDNESNDINEIWDIAVRSHSRFPHGQLIKIEVIPKV